MVADEHGHLHTILIRYITPSKHTVAYRLLVFEHGMQIGSQEIFESLILLIVVHPYDVGDRILLGDDSGKIYTVQKTLGGWGAWRGHPWPQEFYI